MPPDDDALIVAVRLRPLLPEDSSAVAIASVSSECTIIVQDPHVHPSQSHRGASEKGRRREFAFDVCFPSTSSQEDVYASLGRRVLGGFCGERRAATVIAYGQTGSGKTHTMLGTKKEPGLIPRLVERVLASAEFPGQFSISFYEIYNGRVRDLLSGEATLRIRQHPQSGPYVQGLSRRLLRSSADVSLVLELGEATRTSAATLGRASSSRSHAVCCVEETQRVGAPGDRVLNLVDLAGSERPHLRASAAQSKESAFINRSLATLGNVILALSSKWAERGGERFIPYRDSPLTWLLRNSLGGVARTTMIGTISPSESCHSESLSTLRYAHRARSIHSLPQGFASPSASRRSSSLVDSLRAEIARLNAELQHSRPSAAMLAFLGGMGDGKRRRRSEAPVNFPLLPLRASRSADALDTQAA